MRIAFVLLTLLLLWGCGREVPKPEPEPAPPPITEEEPPPEPVPQWRELSADELPDFHDGYDGESLQRAVDRQLRYLEGAARQKTWTMGEHRVDDRRMIKTLRRLRELWGERLDDPRALRAAIQAEFHVMELSFPDRPGILITGYYAPIFEGSLKRDARFRYPLYARPKDVVLIRPSYFDEAMLQAGPTLRDDRLVARLNARREVVPYYDREQIDKDNKLANKGLELVYLADYFESYIFQVQGGGFIRLQDGRMVELNYAGKNGHPYTSIGGMLIREGRIPKERMSIQAIADYFRKRPEEVTRVCYQNKSYVFYSGSEPISEMGPEHYPDGVLGFPVSARRSIATDKKHFPGGWPAYLMGSQKTAEGDARPFSAFVIDQDTGGAIRGAHVDWFLGAGAEAGEDAGRLSDREGRVLFLLIRESTDI